MLEAGLANGRIFRANVLQGNGKRGERIGGFFLQALIGSNILKFPIRVLIFPTYFPAGSVADATPDYRPQLLGINKLFVQPGTRIQWIESRKCFVDQVYLIFFIRISSKTSRTESAFTG